MMATIVVAIVDCNVLIVVINAVETDGICWITAKCVDEAYGDFVIVVSCRRQSR